MIRPIPQQIAFSAVCTKAFGFRSSAFLRICSDRKSRNPTALQKKTTTCLQRFPFRREPRTDAGFQLFSEWWRFGQSSPDGDSCATFSFDSWLTGNVNCRIFFLIWRQVFAETVYLHGACSCIIPTNRFVTTQIYQCLWLTRGAAESDTRLEQR